MLDATPFQLEQIPTLTIYEKAVSSGPPPPAPTLSFDGGGLHWTNPATPPAFWAIYSVENSSVEAYIGGSSTDYETEFPGTHYYIFGVNGGHTPTTQNSNTVQTGPSLNSDSDDNLSWIWFGADPPLWAYWDVTAGENITSAEAYVAGTARGPFAVSDGGNTYQLQGCDSAHHPVTPPSNQNNTP